MFKPSRIPGRAPGTSRLGITTTPLVLAVSPDTDRIAGGGSVTITGSYFDSSCTVTFDGVPATSVVVSSAYAITCNTPAHAVGSVTVAVTNGLGQVGTLVDGFTYVTSTVTSVSPPSGVYTGGDPITIIGTSFVVGSSITFGGVAATGVVYVSETSYTCVSPAGISGQVVDIVMTEAGGAVSTLPQAFIYVTYIIVPGVPAPLLDQPTAPNTTPPSNPITTANPGVRRKPSITLSTAIGNAPSTCTYTVDGSATPPLVNDDVSFTDNGILKFAGTITQVDASYEDLSTNLVYHVTASGYAWQLNRYRPVGKYVNVSPSGIIRDMIGRYAPGYSVAYIDSSIDFDSFTSDPLTITTTFSGQQDFNTCLSAICDFVGDAHWYVDFYKNLHVFNIYDPSAAAVDDLVDGLPSLMNDPAMVVTTDITQIRNRVYVTGAATSTIPNPFLHASYVNSVISYQYIPVSDISPFLSASDTPPVPGTFAFYPIQGEMLVGGLPLRFQGVGQQIQTGNSQYSDNSFTPYVVLDLSGSLYGNIFALLELYTFPSGTSGNQGAYVWPTGLPVAPYSVSDDTSSQGIYGVHEYFISDSNITSYDHTVGRGRAELRKFSLPIVTISYTSRDVKSVAGASVTANLSHPRVSGTFTIQTVKVDQFHDESDLLVPRYQVTADSAARFNFNDMLLYLDQPTGGIILPPGLTGLVPTTVQSVNTQPGGILTTAFTLTSAQLKTLNSIPIEVVPAASDGYQVVIIYATAYLNQPVSFGNTTTAGLFYSKSPSGGGGAGQNSMLDFTAWTAGGVTQSRFITAFGKTQFFDRDTPAAGGGYPGNKSVYIKASSDNTGDLAGRNIFTGVIYYTTVPVAL